MQLPPAHVFGRWIPIIVIDLRRRLVVNILRKEHGTAIVPILNEGNFSLTNPDGLASGGILRNEVRRTVFDVQNADLKGLGVRLE